MTTRQCFYCQDTTRELRPYGPNGETVCFRCGTSTPERVADAKRACDAKLAACAGGPGVIGGEDGPRPLRRRVGGTR